MDSQSQRHPPPNATTHALAGPLATLHALLFHCQRLYSAELAGFGHRSAADSSVAILLLLLSFSSIASTVYHKLAVPLMAACPARISPPFAASNVSAA